MTTDWKPHRQANGLWIVREGEVQGEGWSEVECLLDLMRKLRAVPREADRSGIVISGVIEPVVTIH